MKLPEKIYVHVKGDKITNTWNSTWIGVHDVEYTRTDAFIEKACSFFRQSHHLYTLDGVELQHFIDDFRKVMKGE